MHLALNTDRGVAAALVERIRQAFPAADIATTATRQARPPFEPLSQGRPLMRNSCFAKTPDALLWIGDPIDRGVVAEAAKGGFPMILVDADIRRGAALGLWRDPSDPFSSILTRSKADADALIRRRRRNVAVAGRLSEEPPPPPCDQKELDALSHSNASRPVWSAFDVAADELEPVLNAHRAVMRLSHRSMLVLQPAASAAKQIRTALDASGLKISSRFEDVEPDRDTQVMLADDPAEPGLWLRFSPITFFGRTLGEKGGCDPYAAAALGSAIIFGPGALASDAPRASYCERLLELGAAVLVSDAAVLAEAVERLHEPQAAARLASAAWQHASAGAEATDRVLEALEDALEGDWP